MITVGYHTLLINSKSWVSLQAQNTQNKMEVCPHPEEGPGYLAKTLYCSPPPQRDPLPGWLCIRKEGVIESSVECWASSD